MAFQEMHAAWFDGLPAKCAAFRRNFSANRSLKWTNLKALNQSR
jgi:hypothetical protein